MSLEYPPVGIADANLWTKDNYDRVSGYIGGTSGQSIRTYKTVASNLPYGNGEYKVWSDDIYSGYIDASTYGTDEWPASGAFDKSEGDSSSQLSFATGRNTYTNASDISPGGNLAIEMPDRIKLDYYTMKLRTNFQTTQAPIKWNLYGRNNDGDSWTLLDSQSGLSWSSDETKTFTVSALAYYSDYKFEILRIAGDNNHCSIYTIKLFGKPLEVSQLNITKFSEFGGQPLNAGPLSIINTSSTSNIRMSVFKDIADINGNISVSDLGQSGDPTLFCGKRVLKSGTGGYSLTSNGSYPSGNISLGYSGQQTLYSVASVSGSTFPEQDGDYIMSTGGRSQSFGDSPVAFDKITNQSLQKIKWDPYIGGSGNGQYSGSANGGAGYLGGWLKILFPAEVTLSSYSITCTTGAGARDHRIYGSLDDVTWTLINSVTGITNWGTNQTRTYSVSPSSYRYFMYICGRVQQSNQHHLQEISFVGTKVGSANSNLTWPPTSLNNTSILKWFDTSLSEGTYYISGSSQALDTADTEDSWMHPYKAFNSLADGGSSTDRRSWRSNGGYSNGNYVGSKDESGTGYLGEWLKLQMPTPVSMSQYTIGSAFTNFAAAPKSWKLFGSTDNSSWTLLDTQIGQSFTSNQNKNFVVSGASSYDYYLWVFNACGSGSSVEVRYITSIAANVSVDTVGRIYYPLSFSTIPAVFITAENGWSYSTENSEIIQITNVTRDYVDIKNPSSNDYIIHWMAVKPGTGTIYGIPYTCELQTTGTNWDGDALRTLTYSGLGTPNFAISQAQTVNNTQILSRTDSITDTTASFKYSYNNADVGSVGTVTNSETIAYFAIASTGVSNKLYTFAGSSASNSSGASYINTTNLFNPICIATHNNNDSTPAQATIRRVNNKITEYLTKETTAYDGVHTADGILAMHISGTIDQDNAKPLLHLDANQLNERQGISTSSDVSIWKSIGKCKIRYAAGTTESGSTKPTLLSDSDGYYVNFTNTNQEYFICPSPISWNFKDFNGNGNKGITAFVVMKFHSNNSYERIFDFGNGETNDNIVWSRQSTTANIRFQINNTTTDAQIFISTNSPIVNNSYKVYIVVYDNEALSCTMYQNGTSHSPTHITNNSEVNDRTTTINYIGNSNWATDQELDADMRELIIFNDVLTSNQIDTINTHLIDKWNII